MIETIVTGSNNKTIFCSQGKWKDKLVWVDNQVEFPCPIEGHALEILHHFGDDGKHYCPTGLLICPVCGGIADEPEPYECNKWGKKMKR